jgi:O-antigen/teichoic acid export membrane protein
VNLSNNSRIANNSILLNIRMIFVMAINLYTVRVVLQAIGAEDYGINNVVAGIITMLISVSSVLSTAIQTFYSSSIGENKLERLRDIFSTSINIFLILALIVFIIAETLGLWFVNTQLIIPLSRMYAANWIYQFSIFSFIFSFIHLPYSAAVLAHEDMGIFAIISSAECVLKLISALLIFVIPFDSLVIYGVTLLIVSLLVMLTYIKVGFSKYSECRYQKQTDKKIFKEVISFSVWSLFGSVASVGMAQVITILVNLFFGPLVNTARAISFQFNLAISSFCGSFLMAIRPQMIKSYTEGSYLYLNKIFNLSNKLLFYSLLVIILPLMFEMNTILFFWLKTLDPQTILFSRLILVYILIMSLNNPISIIIQAANRVKQYHVLVETFTLLCVPLTYLLFKSGFPAYSTYIVMILVTIAAHIVRLICLKKFYSPFSYSEYLKSFIVPASFVTLFSSICIFFVSKSNINNILKLPAILIMSFACIVIFVWMFGLSVTEKGEIKKLLIYYKIKISKK